MKRPFILLALFMIAVQSMGQSGVKLYGYIQDVMPGTIARGTDENGNRIETGRQYNYQVYLVAPASLRITPAEVWINHKPFSARGEAVSQTPVVFKDQKNNRILVPRTSQRVLKIITLPFSGKSLANAKEKAATNQLVVVYQLKGRWYTASLTELTRLEPQENL